MKQDYTNLIAFYQTSYGEQNRLQLDQAHSIEFITTMHLLKKYLPGGCSILDCCALVEHTPSLWQKRVIVSQRAI